MPRLTTEDCVATIISFKGGNISDWKRRSKKNIGSDVVRTFENVRTKEMVEVLERNGALYVGKVSQAPIAPVVNQTPPSNKGKVYCVIGERGGETLLYVVDAEEFDKKGSMSHYIPDVAWDETNRLRVGGSLVKDGCMNAQDHSRGWEPVAPNRLRAKLQTSSVFQFSQRFLDFVKQHNADGTIIGDYQINVNQAPIIERKVYYVVTQEYGGTVLQVTDAELFDEKGYQSDETPRAVWGELKRLGYEAGEAMESVIEVYGDEDDLTPADPRELLAKLQTSSVFQFSQAFLDFIKSYNEESDAVIIE